MSSAVDEDTAKAINTGRETIGAMVSSAQTHLQKVFIVFVLGFMGAFYALRMWIWDFLKATAESEMNENVAEATEVITRTPFEVILLQAKIGMLIGIIVTIPALLYFSRDALRRRGMQSAIPISMFHIAGIALTSMTLFVVGIVYAYGVFFPFTFDFLGTISHDAGVNPHWGITEFTEFVALLTISFGLAAQLPLFMGVLAYTEIVPYETFRDKWRHAMVAIVVFGAMFSPPDPFTQIMWAMPLAVLYALSLALAKVLTNIRRRGAAELDTGGSLLKRRLLQLIAIIVLTTGGTAAFVNQGGFDVVEREVYPMLPPEYRPDGMFGLRELTAEHGLVGEVAVGGMVAGGIAAFLFVVYIIRVLQSPVYPREGDIRNAEDPEDVDFETISVDDIEEIPAQVFLSMEEEQALDYSRQAMHDDNREKAEAILNRFDTLQEQAAAEDDESAAAEAGAAGAAGAAAGEGGGGEEEESLFSSTAAGMLDAFTEDETTEEDIGGYAYDLAFIIDSLTSKTIYIVGIFMAVLGSTFFALYQGGFQIILAQFVDRVPDEVLYEVAETNDAEGANLAGETSAELLNELGLVVALHPVEVLIFMVKVSTILGFVSILPFIGYWGWPAAKERGLVSGDSRVFLVWGLALFVGFGVGLFLGFYWIAPAVISYLVSDALESGMVVSYRIKSFSWLVVYTTVGVGFLFNIVVTMALFHVGGIVSYRTMLDRWRPVVVAIFTVAAFASPKGILTMLLVALPIAFTYILGLIVLYVLTAGGRLFGGGGGGQAEPDPEPDPEPDAAPPSD